MSAEAHTDTRPKVGSDGKVEVREHRSRGVVLAGIGAFLLVAGFLVHFYATPKLAVAPMDQNSVTSLEAKGATLFDTGTLKNITTDLSIKARTVGDVAASKKAPGDAVVWVSTTSIRSSDGVVRSRSIDRAGFDEKTGMAVNCCGGFTESTAGDRAAVTRKGLVFKFPFGTEKKTYPFWDSTLGAAVPTKYVGEATVDGMKTYKFESDVPATAAGSQDVPASVLGLPGTGNVTADSMYQNHTTYFVEPTTGAIVDRTGDQKSWFSAEGHDLTTMQGTISYTDAQVKSLVDEISGKVTMLKLAQGIVPWLIALLGAALVVAGTVRGRGRTVRA